MASVGTLIEGCAFLCAASQSPEKEVCPLSTLTDNFCSGSVAFCLLVLPLLIHYLFNTYRASNKDTNGVFFLMKF